MPKRGPPTPSRPGYARPSVTKGAQPKAYGACGYSENVCETYLGKEYQTGLTLSSGKRKKRTGFAARVYQLRRSKGWTQNDLAQAVGVTKSAVVEWEAGRNLPLRSRIPTLCRELKATQAQLMGESPLPKAAQVAHEANLPAVRKALEQAGVTIDQALKKALSALDKLDA